jgi:hypothetical protein
MPSNSLSRVALVAVALLAIATVPARADKCNGAKVKAIGKKESGLLGCSAKEATKTVTGCEAGVSGKFSAAYNKPTGCSPAAPSESQCEAAADSCQSMIRGSLPDGSGTSPSKCEASRLKAASKLASGELGCYSKAAAKGAPVDPACIAKATGKFTTAFDKPSGCTGDGNASGIQTDVENDCVKNMVDVSGGNFVAITCSVAAPTTTTTTTTTITTTTTVATATSTTTSTTLPTGQPIVAPANSWTWVGFPDSSCDDGSPTGIGVNPSSTSSHVLLYLEGGGFCYDYTTCYVLNTATHGPFGSPQFATVSGSFGGSVLDRTLANNPFHDWNLVFVPYCTGDAHGGNNVATYTGQQTTHMYHHVGHANLLAYLARVTPTFPAADRVVVSGASSGGFGAAFNYPDVRARWPQAVVQMVDDSGPLLEVQPSGYAQWFTNWRLDEVTDPVCGMPCRTDPSMFFASLASAYPNDRLALISSLQDQVMRSDYLLSASGFQTALTTMAGDRLDPTAHFHYFFFSGSTHTTLGNPTAFSQNGTTLLTWLTQLATDDPSWSSVHP